MSSALRSVPHASVLNAIVDAHVRWDRVQAAQADKVRSLEPRLRRDLAAMLQADRGPSLADFGLVRRRPGESLLEHALRRALEESDPTLADLATMGLFFQVRRDVRASVGRRQRGDVPVLTASKMFALVRRYLAGERI
jgi:hypothetical protein